MGIISTAIRRGALIGASALLATGLAACNEHPVSLTQATGDVETVTSQSVGGDKFDILWMIDNSGSMCRSQSVVRQGINDFVDVLDDGELDFHIAVTTSHILKCDEIEDPTLRTFCEIEPVARGGHLQATPQPLPGFDDRCNHPIDDNAEPIFERLDPVEESLEAAVNCTEDPSAYEHLLNFDDDEWERQMRCALPTRPIDEEECNEDDPALEELFPDPDHYRDIDLVLRSEDYIISSEDIDQRPDLSEDDLGTLDTQRFGDDFSCMSLVGTRGFGYEATLAAAAKTLSPDMTGGADTSPDQRDEYPTAGFLRSDANTSVIFVSDENDCSVDLDEMDFFTDCGEGYCTIQENRLHQGLDSAMTPIDDLYSEFVLNIMANKNPALADEFFELAQGDDSISIIDDLEEDDPLRLEIEAFTTSIIPGSIHGLYRDLDDLPNFIDEDEVPVECPEQSADGRAWQPPISCQSTFGRAWSGHRFAFFLEKFPLYFPFEPDGRIGGEICNDFSPVLIELAELIQREATACINEVYPCQGLDDMGCPDDRYTGEPGRCLPYRPNELLVPVYPTLEANDIDGVSDDQLSDFVDLAQDPEFSVERAVRHSDIGLDEQARQNLLDAIDQRLAEDEDATFYCNTGKEARLSAAGNDSVDVEDIEAAGYCAEFDSTDPSMPQSCIVNPDRYVWASCDGGGVRIDWNDPEAEQTLSGFDILMRYASTNTTEAPPATSTNSQEEPAQQQGANNADQQAADNQQENDEG